MKKIYLLSTIILFANYVLAQKVTVADKATLQPLEYVIISSADLKTVVTTDSRGKADISALLNHDSILFYHIGYHKTVFSYKQIETMQFVVPISMKSYDMNEVVISASRFEEKKADVPQQIQVINAAEIAFMNPQNAADIIQQTGNAFVQRSQGGGGSPIIRGFEANKVLIVVDGVRMNNAIFRGGHLQNIITMDNSILDKTEVVFGSGSVVYGSDALGGVMHFYTKSPVLADSNALIKANVFSRYSTASNEATEHLDFNIGGKKIAFLTSFTYSDFGDLRQGGVRNPFYGDWGKRIYTAERINGKDTMIPNANPDIQRQTAYKQYDLFEKIRFQQSKNVSHIVNLQYSTSSNIPRYDRLTEVDGKGVLKNAEWYYGPQERLLTSYSLHLKTEKTYCDNAKVTLAYQEIEESRHNRGLNSDNLNHRIENVKVLTANVDVSKAIKRQEIRYGMEETYNIVRSIAFQEKINAGINVPLDTRYPNGGSSMQTIAAYLTHSWEISPKWILSDGIRYSNIHLNAKFKDTTFFSFPFNEITQQSNAINGNLGVTIMPGHDWRFAILATTGFRAPNVDDLSKVFESTPGNIIVPNPDLKPEYTYNGEISASKVINNRIRVECIGFYTLYKDAISTKRAKYNGKDSILYEGKPSQVITQANTNEAYIYGLSGTVSADVSDAFSITSTLNYTYGRLKTDTTDYPLDHIAPVFGKTSFIITVNKLRTELFIAYNGWKRMNDYNLLGEDNQLYATSYGTPAWYTLNIRTAWQVNQYLQAQLALENILDQNYRPFASGISAPGRNLIVTIRGKF